MSISGDNLVDAIKASAESELGIIALIIISMSVVGIIFFKSSKDSIKLVVFLTLMLGIFGFSYSTMQIFQDAKPSNENDMPVNSERIIKIQKQQSPQQNHAINTSSENKKKHLPTLPIVKQLEPEEGFVYLGTFRNGAWSDPRFKGASGEIMVEDVLTLTDDRKIFTCAPYRKTMFSLKYTFCNDVIGDVSAGGKIKVLKSPVMVGLDRVWVYVQEVQ